MIRTRLLVCSLLAASCGAHSQGTSLLAPLAGAITDPGSPWRIVLLPGQAQARTQFRVVSLDGQAVLRMDARASYGNLVHRLQPAANATSLWLSWRWRVDQFVAGSDVRRKASDDNAAKVCVMFDLALKHIPLFERWQLRLARGRSGEPLPGASICYVWDRSLPSSTELSNPYTRRMRYIVLQGARPKTSQWRSERRDVVADFLRVFGDETNTPAPVVAILVGADADNTGGYSVAYVADLLLTSTVASDESKHK